MSHFCVLCVPNAGQSKRLLDGEITADHAISPMLMPYDENIDTEPYDTECGCSQSKVCELVDLAVKAKFGGGYTSHLRAKYKEWERANPDADGDRYWDTLVAPLLAFMDQAKAEAEARDDLIDPDCEECEGTGLVKSDYNPDSKWDWYQVGGRWTGLLDSDYDPMDDPNNVVACPHCKGERRVTLDASVPALWTKCAALFEPNAERAEQLQSVRVALEAGAMTAREAVEHLWPERAHEIEDDTIECWVCHGTGTTVAWPSQYAKHKGDVQTIARLKALMDEPDANNKYIPFAVCVELNDGTSEWLDAGYTDRMRVSTCVNAGWADDFRHALSQIQDDRAVVVVDCHT